MSEEYFHAVRTTSDAVLWPFAHCRLVPPPPCCLPPRLWSWRVPNRVRLGVWMNTVYSVLPSRSPNVRNRSMDHLAEVRPPSSPLVTCGYQVILQYHATVNTRARMIACAVPFRSCVLVAAVPRPPFAHNPSVCGLSCCCARGSSHGASLPTVKWPIQVVVSDAMRHVGRVVKLVNVCVCVCARVYVCVCVHTQSVSI